jgi:uncharacterized protein YjbJ (UPF0337 family)
MGEFIDKAKGAANEAIGKAKQHSGDASTRIEGAVQEAKGGAQRPWARSRVRSATRYDHRRSARRRAAAGRPFLVWARWQLVEFPSPSEGDTPQPYLALSRWRRKAG